MPALFKVFLQNFSVAPVGFLVPPGEEVTVQYELTVRFIDGKGGREGGNEGNCVCGSLFSNYFLWCARLPVVEVSHLHFPPFFPLSPQPKTILRPAPFQVAHTIFYEGEGDDDVFSTTFFNQSILVVAPSVTK